MSFYSSFISALLLQDVFQWVGTTRTICHPNSPSGRFNKILALQFLWKEFMKCQKKKKKKPQTVQWKVILSVLLLCLRLTAAVDRQARTSHLFIKKENIAFHNNLFLCSFFFLSHCISISFPLQLLSLVPPNFPPFPRPCYLMISRREPAVPLLAHVIINNTK